MASTLRSSCPSCGEIQDVPEGYVVVCPMCGGHVEPVSRPEPEPENREGDEVVIALGMFVVLASFLAVGAAIYAILNRLF